MIVGRFFGVLGVLCLPHTASSFTTPSPLRVQPPLSRFRTQSRPTDARHPSLVSEYDLTNRRSRAIALLSGQDIIEAGVSFDTFAPQFLWLLLIAAPESSLTKKVMGPITPIVGLALVHLTIVLLAAAQEGALDQVLIFTEVFDPSMSQLEGMQKLFAFQNFVAEEWPHVLIWDLLVGRFIWLDGLERGVNTRLALAFCNFIGPPGLLIHVATCLITKKGLPSMGYKDDGGEDSSS